MARSERLLDLLQVLRRYRQPVTGRVLAEETGVSLRTLYRDIASLQSQGAVIEGEPGIGYVLRPGFMLPPMMFSREEIEALVLGSRWVARSGDKGLADAATDALAKIAAVLPQDLRDDLDASVLLVGSRPRRSKSSISRFCETPSVVSASCTCSIRTMTDGRRSALFGRSRLAFSIRSES